MHAAIAASDGTANFCIAEHSEYSSLSEDSDAGVAVKTISLGSFFDEYGFDTVDVAKVDIEGAEIDMFMESSASTLQKVAQFTVE
jgi:FkbM family methyltransferase